jgi:Uma2 family endonuclease
MAALPIITRATMTEAEYLEFERNSDTKHEYWGGEVFAMSGASEAHNLVYGSTYALLYMQLRGKSCTAYPSDMRVKILAADLYVYPDISVVCGDKEYSDDRRDTLINPILIVEILSPSTERYDRGKKFQHYRELPSLQEYVLITQDSPRIEKYVRQEKGLWQFSDAVGLEAAIALTSIECTLALAEVYEQVTFSDLPSDIE